MLGQSMRYAQPLEETGASTILLPLSKSWRSFKATSPVRYEIYNSWLSPQAITALHACSVLRFETKCLFLETVKLLKAVHQASSC